MNYVSSELTLLNVRYLGKQFNMGHFLESLIMDITVSLRPE
jgi:hypothetical protein